MALVLGSLCVIAVAGVSIGVNARSRKPRVASGDTECVKDEKTD